MPKTVWILGAGFSRSLGGPLLTDLFSERTEDEITVKFNMKLDAEKNPAQWSAVHFYRWGSKNGMWFDAEDYLDRLDSAFHNRKAKVLKQTFHKRFADWYVPKLLVGRAMSAVYELNDLPEVDFLQRLLLEAKHWMAAECCAFVKDADPLTEKWEPSVLASTLSNIGTSTGMPLKYPQLLTGGA